MEKTMPYKFVGSKWWQKTKSRDSQSERFGDVDGVGQISLSEYGFLSGRRRSRGAVSSCTVASWVRSVSGSMLHMTVERMSGIHVALCNLLMVTYAMFSAWLYNRLTSFSAQMPLYTHPCSFLGIRSFCFSFPLGLSHNPPFSPAYTFFCILCNLPMGAWLRCIFIFPLLFLFVSLL